VVNPPHKGALAQSGSAVACRAKGRRFKSVMLRKWRKIMPKRRRKTAEKFFLCNKCGKRIRPTKLNSRPTKCGNCLYVEKMPDSIIRRYAEDLQKASVGWVIPNEIYYYNKLEQLIKDKKL
jgi:hypothetical protein